MLEQFEYHEPPYYRPYRDTHRAVGLWCRVLVEALLLYGNHTCFAIRDAAHQHTALIEHHPYWATWW